MLKELEHLKVDFAVMGPSEWCCMRPGMNEEFERCREHNLQEIQKLGAKQIIFNCQACYSMWQEKYQPEGIDLIYKESNN